MCSQPADLESAVPLHWKTSEFHSHVTTDQRGVNGGEEEEEEEDEEGGGGVYYNYLQPARTSSPPLRHFAWVQRQSRVCPARA